MIVDTVRYLEIRSTADSVREIFNVHTCIFTGWILPRLTKVSIYYQYKIFVFNFDPFFFQNQVPFSTSFLSVDSWRERCDMTYY